MPPPPGERARQTENDELAALRQLRTHIESVEQRGTVQLAMQSDALASIDAEHTEIDDALALDADAETQKEAGNENMVGDSEHGESSTLAPLLSASDVAAIPILNAHATERRRTRALLSAPQWSTQDIERLHAAVHAESVRANTFVPGSCDPNKPDSMDWVRIAMHVPFHTPVDCRTRWRLIERPGLNMSRWSHAEKRALAEYVAARPNVSWDEAAVSLGTKRLGFQALETFQRGVRPEIEWTQELDASLLQAVQKHGPCWGAVALEIGLHPTCAIPCHQRHLRLKASTLVQGRWAPAEDAALRAAVAEYGCDWKRVEIRIPGRTGQQCRERWVGRLANIPEGETQAPRRPWTAAEDERLRSCVGACKSWVQVAQQVGGRSDKMVRERWLLLKRRDEEKERRGRIKHK